MTNVVIIFIESTGAERICGMIDSMVYGSREAYSLMFVAIDMRRRVDHLPIDSQGY